MTPKVPPSTSRPAPVRRTPPPSPRTAQQTSVGIARTSTANDITALSGVTGRAHGRLGAGAIGRNFVAYNGPITVGKVQFASTEAAIEQIFVENGADGNLDIMRASYAEARDLHG